jgi:N-acetyl-gamma-glutamyl-phosphate reductase
MAKRFKAAVIGGSGYGGAELVRRLLLHPEVELVRVASIDFVGEPLSAVHPNLEGQTELKFEGLSPAEAARGMDVVLLGLPHKVSAGKAQRGPVGRFSPA